MASVEGVFPDSATEILPDEHPDKKAEESLPATKASEPPRQQQAAAPLAAPPPPTAAPLSAQSSDAGYSQYEFFQLPESLRDESNSFNDKIKRTQTGLRRFFNPGTPGHEDYNFILWIVSSIMLVAFTAINFFGLFGNQKPINKGQKAQHVALLLIALYVAYVFPKIAFAYVLFRLVLTAIDLFTVDDIKPVRNFLTWSLNDDSGKASRVRSSIMSPPNLY